MPAQISVCAARCQAASRGHGVLYSCGLPCRRSAHLLAPAAFKHPRASARRKEVQLASLSIHGRVHVSQKTTSREPTWLFAVIAASWASWSEVRPGTALRICWRAHDGSRNVCDSTRSDKMTFSTASRHCIDCRSSHMSRTP